MDPIIVYTIFLFIYALIWISLLVGIVLIRHENKFSKKMHDLLIQKQIQKFRYPPFKNLLELWVSNKYLLTSFTFILIIIIPAVIFFFLLGIILVSPLLAIVQGFTVGNLIGNFKRKEMYWAIIVGTFEFGYWSLSGALGIFVTLGFLYYKIPFSESLNNSVNILSSGYWIPLIICIIINAFGEVAGPMHWKINVPISLEELSKGGNVDKNT